MNLVLAGISFVVTSHGGGITGLDYSGVGLGEGNISSVPHTPFIHNSKD